VLASTLKVRRRTTTEVPVVVVPAAELDPPVLPLLLELVPVEDATARPVLAPTADAGQ
jgi:hypothetical protein